MTNNVVIILLMLCLAFLVWLGRKSLAEKQQAEKDRDREYINRICTFPDDNEVQYILAAEKNPTAVLACLSMLLSRSHPSSSALFLAAQLFSRLDLLDEGRVYFERALEINSQLEIWKTHDPLIRKLYTNN